MPLVLDKPEEAAGPSTVRATPSSSALPVARVLPRLGGLRERVVIGMSSLLNDILGPRVKRAFGILLYHRVVKPPPGQPMPTWNVPPDVLESQLSGLIGLGWRAMPLRQVLDCIER